VEIPEFRFHHLFYILILQAFCLLEAAGQVVEVSVIDGVQHITEVQFMADPDGHLKLPEVESAYKMGSFEKLSPDESGIAASVNVYWIAFSVKNSHLQPVQQFVEFYGWTKINLYDTVSSNHTTGLVTGHLIPFKERNFPSADRCLIKLNIASDQTLFCLVRLEKSPDFVWQPADLSFKIFELNTFQRGEKIRRYIVGFFTGIFIVMFLYNLFVFLVTKERGYVFYLSLLLLMIIVPEFNSGYMVERLKNVERFPSYLSTFDSIANCWIGLFLTLFVMSFFKTKVRMVFWNKFGTVLACSFVLLMIVAIFFTGEISMAIINLTGLIMVIFAYIVSVSSLLKNFPSSLYFIMAQTSFLVAAVLMILTLLGVVPFNDYSLAIVPAGSAIENTLFSFALANKINILRKENISKQNEIIKHLLENKTLQTKVNRELEEEVRKRTIDIEHQKEVIEKEKEKSDNLLLNILPKATADELKVKGYSTPRDFEAISVLFSDVKGFTSISEELTAAELVRTLDEIFQAFDDIVLNYRLEKIKTIGDAYMCASGVPDPDSHRPDQIVRAGLEMQEFMKGWNAKEINLGRAAWGIRIGIHTGPLAAGVVGKIKFAYDLWGDTVNIASRMESTGVVGKVNISEATYHFVKDQFSCTDRGMVEAKNKGIIKMYFVESPALVPG